MRYILWVFVSILWAALPVDAHEGHEHSAPLAVSVAFDAQGQLWRVSAKDGYVLVDVSKDLAKTFSPAVKINVKPQKIGLEGDARPKIIIAPPTTANASGNIYVTWTQALPTPYTGYIWFSRSTDGGKSFSAPMIVHTDRAEITHRFDALAVAPSGRVYVAWVDKRDLEVAKSIKAKYEGAAIYYAVSDDAGVTFKPEQKLANVAASRWQLNLMGRPWRCGDIYLRVGYVIMPSLVLMGSLNLRFIAQALATGKLRLALIMVRPLRRVCKMENNGAGTWLGLMGVTILKNQAYFMPVWIVMRGCHHLPGILEIVLNKPVIQPC